MDRVRVGELEFCIPEFKETPKRDACRGLRFSHPGLSIKEPPVRVRIRDFYDAIEYISLASLLSPIEEPLSVGCTYEIPPSLDGLPIEEAREYLPEPRYTGEVEVSEEDEEELLFAARYASMFSKRLKLKEGPLRIDGKEIEEDPLVLLNSFASIAYTVATKAYSIVYRTKEFGMFEDFGPAPVPVVIGYGDKMSKALAAAYAAHRKLPLIIASKIPSLPPLEDLREEYFSTFRSAEETRDLLEYYKATLSIYKDEYVYAFLKRHLPSRIIYFSPEPVIHGYLFGKDDFLGSYVPEFRMPTEDLERLYALRNESFRPKSGEIVVIRNLEEADLTAYASSVPREKIEAKVFKTYEARLEEPRDESRGIDALERLVKVEKKKVPKRELLEALKNASFLALEYPDNKIETDEGLLEIDFPRGLFYPEPIDRDSFTVMPVSSVPYSVSRRFLGFFIEGLLKDYNFPAALAYAKTSIYYLYKSKAFGSRKLLLMSLLSVPIQGVGEPTTVLFEEPIRYVRNLTVLLNAASSSLNRLRKDVLEKRREIAKKALERVFLRRS